MFKGAGNAVKRATDALVKAAITAKGGSYQQEEITVQVNQRMVGGMAQVCCTMLSILSYLTKSVNPLGIFKLSVMIWSNAIVFQ